MSYKHDVRQCIYSESEEVKQQRLDYDDIVNSQMSRYRIEGFPRNYGLFDSGFTIRKYNKVVNEFNDFIARAQKQSSNSKRFIYALIELDSFADKSEELLKGPSKSDASNTVVKKEDDKKKKEDEASKKSQIKDLAFYIKSEANSYGDTDENAVIKKYNKTIKNEKDMLQLASLYQGNVWKDLRSFLDDSEMGKLAYSRMA